MTGEQIDIVREIVMSADVDYDKAAELIAGLKDGQEARLTAYVTQWNSGKFATITGDKVPNKGDVRYLQDDARLNIRIAVRGILGMPPITQYDYDIAFLKAAGKGSDGVDQMDFAVLKSNNFYRDTGDEFSA